jgi:hypothetical protein
LERSRRISVAEDSRPWLIEMATCIRSRQWRSMSVQSITLRPRPAAVRSPNSSSMCE